MDKHEHLEALLAQPRTVAELCEALRISRVTLYRRLERFIGAGRLDKTTGRPVRYRLVDAPR